MVIMEKTFKDKYICYLTHHHALHLWVLDSDWGKRQVENIYNFSKYTNACESGFNALECIEKLNNLCSYILELLYV